MSIISHSPLIKVTRRSAILITLMTLSASLLGCFADEESGRSAIAQTAKPPGGRPTENQPTADIQYFEVIDRNNGMVQSVSPFPASWRVQQTSEGSLTATGPGGIRLHSTQTANFAWSPDPFTRQSITQMGQQLAPVLSLEQILEQKLAPTARAQGNELVGSYPTPEVEGLWARFGAAMVQTGSQRQWLARGSDWTDGRGTKTFVSIVRTLFRNQQIVYWILQTTSLEAPAEVFEQAKSEYLYAVGNTQINPRWQQMMNGQLVGQIRANESFARDIMARSRAAHQQRMAAIETQGNAARSVGQTYSDILDINHAGYLKRDDMNSAGHSAQIDAIRDRSGIANHETGEYYQVDAGSKYYWVGSDATYFGTDNPLYDPRTDNRINEVEWTKFVQER